MIVIKKDITPTLPTLEEYISDEVVILPFPNPSKSRG
jgi:hypothetical protein